MKLVIFGATGSVGRHVVEQALQQGHEITAFTRNEAGHQRLSDRLRESETSLLPRTYHGPATRGAMSSS